MKKQKNVVYTISIYEIKNTSAQVIERKINKAKEILEKNEVYFEIDESKGIKFYVHEKDIKRAKHILRNFR